TPSYPQAFPVTVRAGGRSSSRVIEFYNLTLWKRATNFRRRFFTITIGGCIMWTFVRASSKVSTAALALLALSSAGPVSGAMAAQFSVGVIEYNAKESQGGWTTQYGDVLAKQIKLIVDKIRDKSNPSPVQFIALDQAKAQSRTCIANDDTLVSCALEHNQLPGWTTI